MNRHQVQDDREGRTQDFVCPSCGDLVQVLDGVIVKDCRCAAGKSATKE